MDWQGVLCFEYCEKISYKNVPGFSDISLRAIKSCFIVLGTIHKHGYTVCHKSCSKEGIAHYDSQNMTFMSCLWLLPECFLMKLKMCVCVHVCVCAIRVCVTEKETSSKKLFFTQARGFHFSPFQKRVQPPWKEKKKAEATVSSYFERNMCNFLGPFSFCFHFEQEYVLELCSILFPFRYSCTLLDEGGDMWICSHAKVIC